MNPPPKPPSHDDGSVEDASLSDAERSELQRQGAKSAARGETAAANPMSQSRNKPPATGESSDTWSKRSDAWEQGHRAQSVTRREETPASRRKDDAGPP